MLPCCSSAVLLLGCANENRAVRGNSGMARGKNINKENIRFHESMSVQKGLEALRSDSARVRFNHGQYRWLRPGGKVSTGNLRKSS